MSSIKKDFPHLHTHPDITYLDSTATSLKPSSVIQKEQEYYQQYSANIHRGIYPIAEQATAEYEETRKVVADFINVPSENEIIFTKGTTEGINLLATALVQPKLQPGDTVVSTQMEHHSNFVPWQQLAQKTGATFSVIPVTDKGYLEIVQQDNTINTEKLAQFITPKTKVFAVTAVSNVLGTINPVAQMVKAVKALQPGCLVIVDAAQAVPHTTVNVQEWGADAVVFSAHKMLGPTGVGVLWSKKEILEQMEPYQYGGEMVLQVSQKQTTFKEIPHKFEAGTPNIAGVIAFKEAIRYLQQFDMQEVHHHEAELAQYAIERLTETFPDITIAGPPAGATRAGIVSFTFPKFHAHDVAQILGEKGVCVRAGHHCAMPLHTALQLPATSRASFYLYNTKDDVEALIKGLLEVQKTLQ